MTRKKMENVPITATKVHTSVIFQRTRESPHSISAAEENTAIADQYGLTTPRGLLDAIIFKLEMMRDIIGVICPITATITVQSCVSP